MLHEGHFINSDSGSLHYVQFFLCSILSPFFWTTVSHMLGVENIVFETHNSVHRGRLGQMIISIFKGKKTETGTEHDNNFLLYFL